MVAEVAVERLAAAVERRLVVVQRTVIAAEEVVVVAAVVEDLVAAVVELRLEVRCVVDLLIRRIATPAPTPSRCLPGRHIRCPNGQV